MPEQVHSKKLYLVIYVALLVLLVLTVAFSFMDLGSKWNNTIAMAIACIKGLLIILFFMHVRFQPWLTWFFAGAGFLWLGIMMTLSLSEYMTRNHPLNSSPKGEPVFLSAQRPASSETARR
jgi:cytochrome c oxidase subunit IV